MTSGHSRTPNDASIRKDATRWFIRLRHGASDREQRAFEVWRDLDPAHGEAFHRIEAAWEATESASYRLADREADQLAVYLDAMENGRPAQGKARKRRARRTTVLSIAIACLLVGGLWFENPTLLPDLFADVATARGERRTVHLPDGSSVLLDADSALTLDFDGDERRIQLLRGAAFFDVAASNKPFVVNAGGGEMRVLGTSFMVRLIESGGELTLAHGRVKIATEAGNAVLRPGQQIEFGRAGLSATRDVDVDEALAWRDGRFVFYRARLGDVLDAIQRYRPGRILLANQALADERVTGSFLLTDTDAVLHGLSHSIGFHMTIIGGRLIVISR